MDYRQPVSDMIVKCQPFSDMDSTSFYKLLQLRIAVFCVEQNCPYQDADGKDINAWHIAAYLDGELAGTARILMPGESYADACSIGRVATAAAFRGRGVGHALMSKAIAQCGILFPQHPIRIGAQSYLQHFYQSLGFVTQGEPFLEDGIVHVTMQREARIQVQSAD